MAVSTLTLRRWHRRFALTLGIFFVIQGITGEISQQRFWLFQATQPEKFRVSASGTAKSPGEVMALLAKEKPDFQVAHMMYTAAVSPNTAVVVMGGRDTTKHDMSYMITVDQFEGRIIQEGSSMSGWVGLASTVHKWLIFGVPGKIILTILGVGVVIFSLLGLVIWWRTRETSKNAKGVVRIHRTAGVLAGLFVISVAGTGTWLNLTTWAEKSSGRSVFASNMAKAAAHIGHEMPPAAIDGNQAYALARKEVGDLHLSAYGPPGCACKGLLVRLHG